MNKVITPYQIDSIDLEIVKSLLKNGRKSLRQISRELKISIPTVNFRFQRLMTIGLIKSISPIIDIDKLDTLSKNQLEQCHFLTEAPEVNLTEDTVVKMTCDHCAVSISNKPQILKFANIERFFCCNSCKGLYKEKNRRRIKSITKEFKNKIKNNVLKSIVSMASLSVFAGICINHGIQHTNHLISNIL